MKGSIVYKFYLDIKSLSKFQKAVIILSFSIYISSFYLTAYTIGSSSNKGWNLLFTGWMGLVIGDFECFPWFANPLFFMALIYFIQTKSKSILFSFIATVLAYEFSTFKTLLTSENGVKSAMTIQLGYRLWVTSFVVLLVGSVIDFYIRVSKKDIT